MRKAVVLVFAALFVGASPVLKAPKFYPDDPIRSDDDRLDTPQEPAHIDLSDMYDRFGHIAHDFGKSPIGSEAVNVNTLDEVPDNTWFTNRHGAKRMSIEELTRGPNRSNGPNPDETWMVFKGKTQGLTPGFEVRDGRGGRYVIKMDPVNIPDLSSAAEVIATKIFYAIGYNAPENYIVRYDPAKFEEDRFGDKAPLTPFRFRRMIRRVPRLPDGRMRVTASKYIPGVPIGPFRYYGTRADDPNDIFPHEDRRELRGFRLIAAWTNHDDTRAQNTQDTWVEAGGKHYVEHYLLDFGSTFGSGSVDMQFPNLSFQYWLDTKQVKRNMWGFGFNVPYYRKVKWPKYPAYQSVGRWEGEYFIAEEWRNDYPNPAFVRMTARDAFWAAKIIMSFTAEELRAIVETGEYSEAELSEYFLEVLIARQQKCGRFGINGINPLDEFRVSGNGLEFTNLSEKYGFSEGETIYRVGWSLYNNATGTVQTLREPVTQSETRLALPARATASDDEDLLLLAEIYSLHDEHPEWDMRIGVYLRSNGSDYEVVGIDRES
jgi:hypothetical protein